MRKMQFGVMLFVAFAVQPILLAAGLEAQAIRGVLLDGASGEPVAQVDLELVASNGSVVERVLSDSSGHFLLAAPVTGIYTIRATRIGYTEQLSAALQMFRGDTIHVEIRLGVNAVILEPVGVSVPPTQWPLDSRLERRGYYERRDVYGEKTGFGHFIDAEAIRARAAFRVTDLLRHVPGLMVTSLGGRSVDVRSIRNTRCRPKVYVDGVGLRIRRGETLNDVIFPSSIAAIEVYPGSVFPAQFAPAGCGSIVIWTGYAEGM